MVAVYTLNRIFTIFFCAIWASKSSRGCWDSNIGALRGFRDAGLSVRTRFGFIAGVWEFDCLVFVRFVIGEGSRASVYLAGSFPVFGRTGRLFDITTDRIQWGNVKDVVNSMDSIDLRMNQLIDGDDVVDGLNENFQVSTCNIVIVYLQDNYPFNYFTAQQNSNVLNNHKRQNTPIPGRRTNNQRIRCRAHWNPTCNDIDNRAWLSKTPKMCCLRWQSSSNSAAVLKPERQSGQYIIRNIHELLDKSLNLEPGLLYHIEWVPGHMDIHGNIADEEVKWAAKEKI